MLFFHATISLSIIIENSIISCCPLLILSTSEDRFFLFIRCLVYLVLSDVTIRCTTTSTLPRVLQATRPPLHQDSAVQTRTTNRTNRICQTIGRDRLFFIGLASKG